MAKFAVLDGENVINVIVADSKEVAEEVTGKTCIEFATENADIGGTYTNGTFIKRKPYASWILNSFNEWEAPVQVPVYDKDNPKNYIWDETTVSWVEN